MDAKKPSSIAKLAAQVATIYQACESALMAAKSGYFPKWWLGTTQVRPLRAAPSPVRTTLPPLTPCTTVGKPAGPSSPRPSTATSSR